MRLSLPCALEGGNCIAKLLQNSFACTNAFLPIRCLVPYSCKALLRHQPLPRRLNLPAPFGKKRRKAKKQIGNPVRSLTIQLIESHISGAASNGADSVAGLIHAGASEPQARYSAVACNEPSGSAGASAGLSPAVLAAAPIASQKLILGEHLRPKIQKRSPLQADSIIRHDSC